MCLIASASIAQVPDVVFPIDSVTKKITFTGVVSVDSATKDQLFIAAKTWAAESFKNAKEVTQVEDKASGTLILQGHFAADIMTMGVRCAACGYTKFQMTILVKEGRYKYTITNLYHDDPVGKRYIGGELENEKPLCGKMTMYMKQWQSIKKQAFETCTLMVSSLDKKMQQAINTSKEDW